MGIIMFFRISNKSQDFFLQLWPFISYNWIFLWDKKTFYKWGFLSTYHWYNSGLNCGDFDGKHILCAYIHATLQSQKPSCKLKRYIPPASSLKTSSHGMAR